jgi:hypothetical protein
MVVKDSALCRKLPPWTPVAPLPRLEAFRCMKQVPSPISNKLCVQPPRNESHSRAHQDGISELCWPSKYDGRGVRAELKKVLKGRFHGRE